tara:strand:+ start:390 stop:1091 length:702 start_codon:yes stop_codon:yes gene_type:complete
VLAAANLLGASTGSEIEKKVLEFAEWVKSNESGDEPEDADWNNPDESSIEASLRNQGVPERIISTLNPLSTIVKTEAIQAVELFMKTTRTGWCLVLSGCKGCGKSTAAASYLMARTRASENISQLPKNKMWWTAANISRVSSYVGQLENLMTLPVLVIDDLGVEYMDKNGHFNSRLDELLSYRYDNFKKTIITTNLNSVDFEKRYEKRITSRIKEGIKFGGNFAHIKDKSLRT